MEEYNRYFHIKPGTKVPEYYIFMGGRGNGHTFFELQEKAFVKMMNARVTDKFFESSNYVWLVGNCYKHILGEFKQLYGVKILYIQNSNDIRLYKEVR